MATVIDVLGQLFASVVDLVVIFATQIATRDPITFLVFATGAVITAVSVGVFGVLAVGGLTLGLRS